jgi:hypothetical protein
MKRDCPGLIIRIYLIGKTASGLAVSGERVTVNQGPSAFSPEQFFVRSPAIRF